MYFCIDLKNLKLCKTAMLVPQTLYKQDHNTAMKESLAKNPTYSHKIFYRGLKLPNSKSNLTQPKFF